MLTERVSFHGAWEKQTGIEEQEFVSVSQAWPEVGWGWGGNGRRTETSVILQFHFSWPVNTLSLHISFFQV